MHKINFKITLVFEGTLPEIDQDAVMDSIGNIEGKDIIGILKNNITGSNTTFKINKISWVEK